MSKNRFGRRRAFSLATGLVAVAAAASLLIVPSALGISVTPANGRDFVLPNSDVYQLGPKGTYHLIPDVSTANAMGLDWDALRVVGSVGPIGAAFPSILPAPVKASIKIVAATTKANGADFVLPNGSLFQRDAKGVYHWVPNVTTANAMGIKWNQVRQVKSVSPIGDAISSVVVRLQPTCDKRTAPATMATGKDYIVPPNRDVYQLDAAGVYQLVPDVATANAMGIKWHQLHEVHSVGPVGTPIRSICVG